MAGMGTTLSEIRQWYNRARPLCRGMSSNHEARIPEPIPQSQERVAMEFVRAQFQLSEVGTSCDELGTYICHDPDLWRKVEGNILKSRGWATQEIVLASRVLYFGKNQVFWECNKRRACETFPGGIPRHSGIKLSTSLPPAGGLVAYGIDTRPRDVYELWDKIIELYSAAEFSHPAKDKLLAIGGVASMIGIQNEYLAGLWKDDLPRQLLWKTDGGIHSRPLKYQAPTWSWASLDGKVLPRWSEHNFKSYTSRIMARKNNSTPAQDQILIQVIEAKTELTHPHNRFGPVDEGYIMLHAIMFRPQDVVYDDLPISFWMDMRLEHPHITVDMFCLPILRSNYEIDPSVFGLLLQRKVGSPGTYDRCGHFDMSVEKFESWISRSSKMTVYDGMQPEDHLGISKDIQTGIQRYKVMLC
jgi:hypothetical protein